MKRHTELVIELKKHKGKVSDHKIKDSYLKSGHFFYDVSVPDRRSIAKNWVRKYQNISDSDFLSVLDALFDGKSHEEKTLPGMILQYYTSKRARFPLSTLPENIKKLQGWAEVDSLAQSSFTAEDIESDFRTWKKMLVGLSISENISCRRASLVFLTNAVRQSKDKRLLDLAFLLIESLKTEKDTMITKAISWLLRSLVKNHREDVEKFLIKNKNTLPSIAVRETIRKLTTGKK